MAILVALILIIAFPSLSTGAFRFPLRPASAIALQTVAAFVRENPDAYDAITSVRPYKKAETHEEAVRRILVDKGKHFDPTLVDAFTSCLDEFESIQRLAHEQAAAVV